MSLLDRIRLAQGVPKAYERLGYLSNPFPARGQVNAEVFATRPELGELQQDLENFIVQKDGVGRFYALGGSSGVGKSNYLRHVEWTLKQVASERPNLAWHYMTSQQASSRALTQGVLSAIGEERLRQLLWAVKAGRIKLPSHIVPTDLGRFMAKLPNERRQASDFTPDVRFLARWIGGEQTYSSERNRYDIQAKERMVPATALSFLRSLTDLLEQAGYGVRLILLLDEFEDVQALRSPAQTDYLMAIKGMANTFNLERVFLIIGGQEAAFEAFGLRVPSLQTRWKRVRLNLLSSSESAVLLAHEYKKHAHAEYVATVGTAVRRDLSALEPIDDIVKAKYIELAEASQKSGGRMDVLQRDLLDKLYSWVESRLTNS